MSVSVSARPLTADEDSRWIVSILPARGQGRQLGVVALDSDSATMRVSHLAADSPTYVNTVHLLAGATPPAVVLLPATSTTDPQVGMLVKALQANFSEATLVPVMRKYWTEQASARAITVLSVLDPCPDSV
jgi:DNA mismatch repair protein MSH4